MNPMNDHITKHKHKNMLRKGNTSRKRVPIMSLYHKYICNPGARTNAEKTKPRNSVMSNDMKPVRPPVMFPRGIQKLG